MHKILSGTIMMFSLVIAPLMASPVINVYAGGVAGVEALANPTTSVHFRKSGGGVYLHNNGWAALSPDQQRQVLVNFQNRPIGIELGFKESGDAWAMRLKDGYLALGMKPTFIAANAFDGNNHPTPEQWEQYSNALRGVGLPKSTLILPTFEYANFGPNLATLGENLVSQRKDFQGIIKTAGGIVLDCPPGYAFNREAGYRAWIIDAVQWTRKQKLTVVWITSPHIFYQSYREDTDKFLQYLNQRNVLPTIIVCENYEANPPANYPNMVGHEDQPETSLGVAWYLLHTAIPGMKSH